MSTLTLSRVMMPCDWIGIVTIRSDTRWMRSISGMMKHEPRPARSVLELAEAELHAALVLLEDPHRRAEHDERQHADHGDDHPGGHSRRLLLVEDLHKTRIANVRRGRRVGIRGHPHARHGRMLPGTTTEPWWRQHTDGATGSRCDGGCVYTRAARHVWTARSPASAGRNHIIEGATMATIEKGVIYEAPGRLAARWR